MGTPDRREGETNWFIVFLSLALLLLGSGIRLVTAYVWNDQFSYLLVASFLIVVAGCLCATVEYARSRRKKRASGG